MSEEKFLISFDGTKIYYHITKGHPNKYLIFLHGLGGDLTSWKAERRNFDTKGYSTIAIDLRGHGLSGHAESIDFYSIENMVKDVLHVVKHEKVEKGIVIGHCFGGMIGMSLAATSPEFLKGLILVDSSYKPTFLGQNFSSSAPLVYFANLLAPYLPSWHKSAHRNFAQFSGTGDVSLNRFCSDMLNTSLQGYLLLCETLCTYDAEKLLKKITVPTLVIEGSMDMIFPRSVAENLSHRIKKSTLEIIEGGNHILVISNPKQLDETIERFLEKVKF